ncbi:MAG: AzlD domain-containing protein [Syntrophomonadaceae bacterium]|jgi:branched-subunit amino acid transport protein|nr:AzlD domain-containing protein [Syntrophomonadaceae bacterium]
MNKLILVVVAMALVTYIPRLIPLLLLGEHKLPPFLSTFLEFVPYAVLAALIFPGVLSSTGDMPSSAAGALACFILSWLRFNIMAVVLGGIGVALLASLLI